MTEHQPFETSPDAQAWRLSRREAAVNERERQVALREKELVDRDAARQRAEAALEAERQRTIDLERQLAALETALAEQTASLRRTQDEADGLRTSLGRMSRRGREPDPVPSGRTSAATERWVPVGAKPAGRRRS